MAGFVTAPNRVEQKSEGSIYEELSSSIISLDLRLRYISPTVSTIIEMLEQEGTNRSEKGAKQPEVLNVRLIEDKGESTSAKRVIFLVESIEKMYDAFARLDGTSDQALQILALDSGSDKSFDFTGASSIINSTKGFLLSFYDVYAFHRKTKSLNFIEVASASLDVFERVDAKEKDGVLSAQEAQIIRSSLTNGLSGFISVGAITPEIENSETESPQ